MFIEKLKKMKHKPRKSVIWASFECMLTILLSIGDKNAKTKISGS